MQIVVRTPSGDRELDVLRERPDAVVGDLVAALYSPRGAGDDEVSLVIDGRAVDPDLDLDEAGLVNGSLVQLIRSQDAQYFADPNEMRQAHPVLALVGGPASGRSFPLVSDGDLLVGRSAQANIVVADPTVSPEHAVVSCSSDAALADGVMIADLQSHNGTRADGMPLHELQTIQPGTLLNFGATEAVIRLSEVGDRPLGLDPARFASAGSMAFNRPPRPALPPEVDELKVPDPPANNKSRSAFNFAMLVGPIVMGGVMVMVMGNIRYAIFMLMSPIMMISNGVSRKRQNKKENKSSARQFKLDMATFREDLASARESERARRDAWIPDLAEVVRRAELPSTLLWQRRGSDNDYLHFRVGRGPVLWAPPMDEKRLEAAELVRDAVDEDPAILRCPVDIDLSSGGVVGIVGDRTTALAVARSLVAQAAVHHGPADLPMAIFTTQEHGPAWDWAKWLPHIRSSSGDGRMLSVNSEASKEVLDAWLANEEERSGNKGLRVDFGAKGGDGPSRLVVIDDESLTAGRRAPARSVLRGKAGPVAGIVIASTADRLPSVCNSVVYARDDLGDAEVHQPQLAQHTPDVVIAGMDEDTARYCARQLSRFEDPEVEVAGAGIPSMVKLLPLLDMEDINAAGLLEVWSQAGTDPAPSAPVGVGDDGVVEINMVKDGPHGLVGGTTGSGKSEFLRSLVAGMAARVDPDHLVFVLVDYKGGSAFDECAKLPHTVGMVTDLDDHLAERALKSLEAELHHRERELREAGATDLPEYLKMGSPRGPMPRLMLVVDEFATLATELPEFMGALVGVAQRGRSLGVHMLLATQRPSGAVNANIKANTNMRIALRVQDVGDSQDIIERADAAKISRKNPGRAYFRLGPTDVIPVQTALSTASSVVGECAAISVAPFLFGARPSMPPARPDTDEDAPTDLARLVQAANEAFLASGAEPPRRPWLEMMSDSIPLRRILDHADSPVGIPLGILDDPEHQSQAPVFWDPAEGHLFFSGMVGNGTTNALVATMAAAVSGRTADQLHLYGLDYGGGTMSALSAFPHTGAVVAANESERQNRLVHHLRGEVARRRDLDIASRAKEPLVILGIDDVGAFLADHEGMEGQDLQEAFKRLVAEGPAVGVVLIMTGERPNAMPMRMLGGVANKVFFKHADENDFSHMGVRVKELPTFVPGRAVHGPTKLVLQVGFAGEEPKLLLAELAKTMAPATGAGPEMLAAMPVSVDTDSIAGEFEMGDLIKLPLGVDEAGNVMCIDWHPGDHVLIGGQPRSGVTTALRMLVRQLRAQSPDFVLVGVAEERSALYREEELFDALGTAEELEKVFKMAVEETEKQWFILVDDAHRLEEGHGLEVLAKLGRKDCRLIVGARTEELMAQYTHWTRPVRRSGLGMLLQPKLSTDGDLVGIRLPRRVSTPMVPGRGFLISAGQQTIVQMAGGELDD